MTLHLLGPSLLYPAGIDYESVEQALTFLPNQRTMDVSIPIIYNEMPQPCTRLFFGQLTSDSSNEVVFFQSTTTIIIADESKDKFKNSKK